MTEGWLVARLDLGLGTDEPYGTAAGAGTVAALLLADVAEALPARTESAEAIAGSGLAGDRYARRPRHVQQSRRPAATSSPSWRPRRSTRSTCPGSSAPEHRHAGIDLNALVGRRFRVGAVECIGRRLAEPCSHLERLTRPGLMRPLVHRAGLRADILTGGTVTVGDTVSTL